MQKLTQLLFILLLSVCSAYAKQGYSPIKDLHTYSQDIYSYSIELPQVENGFFKDHSQKFKDQFFLPWNSPRVDLQKDSVVWGLMYKGRKTYGANYRKHDSRWFDQQVVNANLAQYNQNSVDAITVKNANMRVFPTHDPIFFDPTKPGEGYPFDYNQNSGIKINTPIKISHFSKDRQWVFAQSGFASGWIHVDAVATVSPQIKNTFMRSSLYIAKKDNFPLYRSGIFRENIKLGTVIPKSHLGNFFVLNRSDDLSGYIQTVSIDKTDIAKFPLPMDKINVKSAIDQLISEEYGWGELFYKRDCSAMTRDYFSLFGIYLGRNSYTQTKLGEYIDIQSLTPQEKKEAIMDKAVPFLSLIYLRGHIMLYLGIENGEPIVFHNFWGVTTVDSLSKEGRLIVGKAAITSLEPGSELPEYDPQKNILYRVKGIVNLNGY